MYIQLHAREGVCVCVCVRGEREQSRGTMGSNMMIVMMMIMIMMMMTWARASLWENIESSADCSYFLIESFEYIGKHMEQQTSE